MYCNHCGAQQPDGSKFCNSCGAELATQPPGGAKTEEKKEPKSKVKFYIGIALLAVGALFIIWPACFPHTMSMCADGLDKTEIASLAVCVAAFGGAGAWFMYKNKK